MSNSPLAKYKRLSKKYSSGRTYNHKTYQIDRITPHCIVGQWTGKQAADYFATTSRNASCNYAIGKNGDIALVVEEKNRSWCSSSGANDVRAVTIECASDTVHPYAFTQKCFTALVDLCVDICERNGKKKLLWIPNRTKAIVYSPKPDEMVLTVHRWFASKACPGDWLMQRMNILADTVTQRLNKPKVEPKKEKVEDDEVVDKTKVLFNGKEFEVTRIMKDGVNYVKLRDFDDVLGIVDVDYDNDKKLPIIKSK